MASIQKRPSGKYRARYRDEAGKEHARHFDLKLHAQRWLDEVSASMLTGRYVDPKAGKITFANYYALWADRQTWAPGTRRAMDLAAGSVTFADVPLSSLKPLHIEAWIKAMSDGRGFARPLAVGTIKTRFNNVRGALRAAVADRVLAEDPTVRVRLPRAARRDASMILPTATEVALLLEVAEEDFAPFIALCAFAGLRLGEAAGVQVRDFDFLSRTLRVDRQVQRAAQGVEVRPPKARSERVIYAPDMLLALVSEHVRRHGLGDQREAWLFHGSEPGIPPHQNTVGHRWRQTLKRAGVAFKLHDLRHFYASGLIAAGCDVVTVQRALGHASATTTFSTYAHLWPDAEERTRAAAQGLMDQVLRQPGPIRAIEERR